jgi:Xaa-Pro dipeptidase
MRAGLAAVKLGASENDFVAAMMGSAISAGSEYVGMEPLVSAAAAPASRTAPGVAAKLR